MSRIHPLEGLAQRVERAFEAIENPGLIQCLKDNPQYCDVHVETTDDEFKVKLDLNAINPDEVQLSCAYGLLILTAVEPEDTEIGSGSEELIAETDEANPDLEQLESYLPFHYQITLPTNIDPTAVTIAFVEDMLEIQLIKLKEVPLAIAS